MEHSGLSIQVSGADLSDLEAQIREAVLYLTANRIDLKRLLSYPGIEEKYLSFAIEARNDLSSFIYFPPSFVTLAGDIGLGIHLCQFQCSDDRTNGSSSGPDLR